MTSKKVSPDIQAFLERTLTQHFLVVARQFIQLIEIRTSDNNAFYNKAHTALVDLYAAGHKLEQIELKYSVHQKDYDWKINFENKNADQISELKESALYWEVHDPTYFEMNRESTSGWTITHNEPSQGWLVDDFAEIYQDLKTELYKIDHLATDEAIEDALWQLKWGFTNHWGKHCINALRYLHYLLYNGKLVI